MNKYTLDSLKKDFDIEINNNNIYLLYFKNNSLEEITIPEYIGVLKIEKVCSLCFLDPENLKKITFEGEIYLEKNSIISKKLHSIDFKKGTNSCSKFYEENNFFINGIDQFLIDSNLTKFLNIFEFVEVNENIIITKIIEKYEIKKIVIPDYINGKKVIGFKSIENKFVEEIVLNKFITHLNKISCQNLKKINLDNITYFSSNCLILSNLSIDIDFTKVKYIGFCPFGENKIYNIKLKECKLGENAFAVSSCEKIDLSEYKGIIPNKCFIFSKIKEIIFGDEIKEVESFAFVGSIFNEISLGKGIKEIKKNTFSNMPFLKTIDLSKTSIIELRHESIDRCTTLNTIIVNDRVNVDQNLKEKYKIIYKN